MLTQRADPYECEQDRCEVWGDTTNPFHVPVTRARDFCHRNIEGYSTHLRFAPSVSVVIFLVTAMRARCQFLRARSSFL